MGFLSRLLGSGDGGTEGADAPEAVWECQTCGQTFDERHKLCPRCGGDLVEVDAATGAEI